MKVYKYRGVEKEVLERDIKTFSNNQFFAPILETLNDPFEANFNEIISHAIRDLRKKFSFDKNEMVKLLNEIFAYKEKVGIFSVSRTCFSEQMWAYYASSHKGYCIEYELEKLKDKTRNIDFSLKLDIAYSDIIPTLDFNDIKGQRIIQKMFGVKKMNWKHEEETRLLFDASSIKNHHESAITAIYFGYLASEELIKLFSEAFQNRDIKFYRIQLNKAKNELTSSLILELSRVLESNLNIFNFDILKYKDNSVNEIYYLYLKDRLTPEGITQFAYAFKEKYCHKPAIINIFNSDDIVHLIGKYPLKGNEYIKYESIK